MCDSEKLEKLQLEAGLDSHLSPAGNHSISFWELKDRTK